MAEMREQKGGSSEELVTLYEDGYKEIQLILTDADLSADEQLDFIADIVFDDATEEG